MKWHEYDEEGVGIKRMLLEEHKINWGPLEKSKKSTLFTKDTIPLAPRLEFQTAIAGAHTPANWTDNYLCSLNLSRN